MKRQVSTALCALNLLTTPAHPIVDGRRLGALTSGIEARLRERAVKIVARGDDGGETQFCSGYLRDENTVVSAGHCFDDETSGDLARGLVFAVKFDGSKGVQVELVDRELDGHADLSVLRLHGRFPLRETPRTAWKGCDPKSPVYTVGYGIDESEDSGGAARLATYGVRRAGETWMDLEPHQGRICDGDSGGPAYCLAHGQLAFAGVVREIGFAARSFKPDAPESPLCRSATEATITAAPALDRLRR